MKYLDNLFFLVLGLFFPALVFAQATGRMGEGMMDGWMTSGMGILMMLIWFLLIVLLVLAILALIKYLRNK